MSKLFYYCLFFLNFTTIEKKDASACKESKELRKDIDDCLERKKKKKLKRWGNENRKRKTQKHFVKKTRMFSVSFYRWINKLFHFTPHCEKRELSSIDGCYFFHRSFLSSDGERINISFFFQWNFIDCTIASSKKTEHLFVTTKTNGSLSERLSAISVKKLKF